MGGIRATSKSKASAPVAQRRLKDLLGREPATGESNLFAPDSLLRLEGLLGGIPATGEPNVSAPVAHVRLKGYVSAGLSREDWDADLGTVPVSEQVALQYPGLYALMVSGDSLESQGTRTGDLLFLNPAANLRSDKLYVIHTETGELALRVINLEEGRILLRSGFDRYEELTINGAEFLGQVVWHLRRMD